jgi:hypothetical protein
MTRYETAPREHGRFTVGGSISARQSRGSLASDGVQIVGIDAAGVLGASKAPRYRGKASPKQAPTLLLIRSTTQKAETKPSRFRSLFKLVIYRSQANTYSSSIHAGMLDELLQREDVARILLGEDLTDQLLDLRDRLIHVVDVNIDGVLTIQMVNN